MSQKGKAIEAFRAAFDRLKRDKPEILNPGSRVTQNNVAREAGRDPSALRTSRYPELIAEIQAYNELQKERQPISGARDNRNRGLKRQNSELKNAISKLSSIVAAQDQKIIDLLDEIDRLKAGVVSSLPKASTTWMTQKRAEK